MRTLPCVGALITAGLAPASSVLGQADFVRLGPLPGVPVAGGRAYAVSADGSTVTGSSIGIGGTRAYRWTAAQGMQDLGLPHSGPNDLFQGGLACSPTGQVIVGELEIGEPGSPTAFYWTEATGAVVLPPSLLSARGVTNDAMTAIVGRARPSGAPFPFAMTWAPLSGLTQIAPRGWATAATSDGVVVGTGAGTSGGLAFRWSQQGGLVPLSTTLSTANAITPNAARIVGALWFTPARGEAVLWSEGQEVVLGDLPGGAANSEALGISADGGRIIGRGATTLGSEAFVYEGALGLRNLRHVLVKQHGLGEELLGWRLESANGISADGTVIVGTGFHTSNPNGEAFLVRLPRCPGDYDRDGAFTPADVGAFVAAWFDSLAAGNDWGDFDLDDQVTPADVASFVKAWYAAATGACP
jgi:probable HAF family extracellular repeat protein